MASVIQYLVILYKTFSFDDLVLKKSSYQCWKLCCLIFL